MPHRHPSDRTLRLLATARKHPQFAQRIAMQLPEQLRLQFVEELSKQANHVPTKRPGLKKCAAEGASGRKPETNGYSAQLNLFARSVARVG